MADLGAFAVCSRRVAGNLSVGRLPASGGGGVKQAMCVMCEQCAGTRRCKKVEIRRCREQEWNHSNSNGKHGTRGSGRWAVACLIYNGCPCGRKPSTAKVVCLLSLGNYSAMVFRTIHAVGCQGGRQRWDVGVGLDGVVESGRDAPAKPMCFLQLGTLPFPQVSTNIRSIWERMPLCPPCTAEKCVTSNTYN
jgi:hypothetical protein